VPFIQAKEFPFGAGVTVPLSLLYIVRLIYFLLTLAGVMSANDNGLGTFVIVEIPMLLHLLVAIYFVVNWAYFNHMISKLVIKTNAQVWRSVLTTFVIITVCLFAFFLIFFVTFAAAVPPATGACIGRLIDNAERLRIGSIVDLSYRIAIGGLSLIVGVGYLLVGSYMHRRFTHSEKRSVKDDSKTGQRRRRRYRMFMLTGVCSLSLCLMALFMLTVSGFHDYHNNPVSLVIILVAEALPGAVVLIMLNSHSDFKSSSGSKTTKAMSTTTGSKTGTVGGSSSAPSSVSCKTTVSVHSRSSSSTKSAESVSA